jgi:uncharacterized protein
MVDPQLLAILVCPKCRGKLRVEEDPPRLLCDQCRLLYEIRDGIPIMLIDEAKPF